MNKELAVDPVVLREEVKTKYREVALNPGWGISLPYWKAPLRGGSVMILRYSSRCVMRQSNHLPA
jgi:hypothetical protein